MTETVSANMHAVRKSAACMADSHNREQANEEEQIRNRR